MYKRWAILIFLLLVGAGMLSCAQQTMSGGTVVSVSEVRAHPLDWNGKTISLQGFIEVERTPDPLAFSSVPRLFASRRDAISAHNDHSGMQVKKAIDLRALTKSIDQRLESFPEVTCVILQGKFQAYHGLFIGIGVYESDTGIINVTGIRKCDEKTQNAQ